MTQYQCPSHPTDDAKTMTSSIHLSLVVILVLLCPVFSESIDPSVQDLISRNADFAARLYRTVASQTDDNIFLSPFMVSAGLMALLNMTSGETRDQLQQGLTLTGLEPQDLPGMARVKGLVSGSRFGFQIVFRF